VLACLLLPRPFLRRHLQLASVTAAGRVLRMLKARSKVFPFAKMRRVRLQKQQVVSLKVQRQKQHNMASIQKAKRRVSASVCTV